MPAKTAGFDLKSAVAKTLPKPEAAITQPLQAGKLDALKLAAETQTVTVELQEEVDLILFDPDTVQMMEPQALADHYLEADEMLGRISSARRVWGNIWDRIQEKTIKPIRSGLEELYGLNRDVDRPLVKLEESVKSQMDLLKAEERRRIVALETAKREEAERLARAAQEAEAKAAAAKTPQLRGKLIAAAQRISAQAIAVAQTEAPVPIRGANSDTRTTPAWEVSNLTDFLVGVAEGTIPAEAITINTVFINKQFKAQPEVVASWPGVTTGEKDRTVRR